VSAPPDALRRVHPTVLDACFQLLGIAMGLHVEACVPTSLELLALSDDGVKGLPANEPLRMHLVAESIALDAWKGSVDVYSERGRIAAVRGLVLTAIKVHPPSDLSLLRLETVPLRPVALDAVLLLPAETSAALALTKLVALLQQAGQRRPLQVLVSEDVTGIEASATVTLTKVAVASYDAVPVGSVFDVVCCTDMSSWQVRDALVPGGYGVLADGTILRSDDEDEEGTLPRTVVLGPALEALEGARSRVRYAATLDEALAAVEATGARVLVDSRGLLLEASAVVARLLELTRARRAAVPVLVFAVAAGSPELWGFSRTARNEFSALSIYTCDVAAVHSMLAALTRTRFTLREFEMTGDKGAAMVPRLYSSPLSSIASSLPTSAVAAWAEQHFRLCIDRPGQLQSLSFHRIDVAREAIAPHEIRVNVSACALHFKDLMLALNMLPGFRPVLGLECAGVVAEIGSAAKTNVAVGDAVLCVSMSAAPNRSETRGMMASSVVCEAHEVVRAPPGVPLEAAAGFLGVMATAYYCLVMQARVRKGEWVLIHSAMGGVGQSAVQLARSIGCRIIASAGSAEKRAKLTQMGAEAVIDSHNPSLFYEAIMKATGGRGVDVCLNSLAGDGLVESARCLAPLGRFCEIGKADILANAALGLGLLKQNVTFYR
jgi:NADPH:quinone reductase-like Zn-dependent oxidoreductase